MIDLTHYTTVRREGTSLRFGNILNKWDFPTIEEAKQFERLYNSLAVDALEEMMCIIKKHNIVRDAEKLNETDLASHASLYYTGGGIGVGSIRGPTLSDVLDKTKKLYELSKNIKLLQNIGLI